MSVDGNLTITEEGTVSALTMRTRATAPRRPTPTANGSTWISSIHTRPPLASAKTLSSHSASISSIVVGIIAPAFSASGSRPNL